MGTTTKNDFAGSPRGSRWLATACASLAASIRRMLGGFVRTAGIGSIRPEIGAVGAGALRSFFPNRPAPEPKRNGAAAAAPARAPGRVVAGRFGTDSPRDYLLYVPKRRSWRRAPLLVLLHGCKQDARDFAAGTRMNEVAEEHGVFVLYPEQSAAANSMRCWNWYDWAFAPAASGEAALLAAMTEAIARKYRIDRSRIYVAGLSAGGAMAAVLGRHYPKLFAAVGVHSGVPAGAARSLPAALLAMRRGPRSATGAGSTAGIATIVFHGDNDRTVHPSNGAAIHTRIAETQPDAVEWKIEPSDGGRPFTRSVRLRPDGGTQHELWMVHGAGHAWSGGSPEGSYTDPSGPDASREMLRFFLQHRSAG